ncbi:hypothetical protein [uncultured Actinomyces sp.]|uniref:hypothetical protein n=1 Tax=uncultured Actinomyces sp. TaxID=249061 RepID=UPI0028EED67E|nr:hypothetical protein [uncultured Actinomyces sp.]
MDQLTFKKTIKTDTGGDIVLTRVTDDAADANTLRAQGWAEAQPDEPEAGAPTLPAPPASTQRRDN